MISIIVISFLLAFTISLEKTVNKIGLEVSIEESFTQDRLEDLFTVVLESDIQRPVFQFQLDNRSGETVEQVSLVVEISSEKKGLLVAAHQDESSDLTLQAGQSIDFTNLNVVNHPETGPITPLLFDFTITANGRKILQNLRKGSVITDDTYRVTVRAEDKNSERADVLAEQTARFDTVLKESEFLIETDNNKLTSLEQVNVKEEGPTFSWMGEESSPYRLLIVRDSEGNNIENIITQRFNTPHSAENIRDIENGVVLDIMVRDTVYKVPDNLSNLFEQGEKYIWQVKSNKETIDNELIEAYSERLIFEPCYSIEGELKELMISLFGIDKTEEFIENDLLLDQIEIDGVEYSNREVMSILRELSGKIEENKVRVTI